MLTENHQMGDVDDVASSAGGMTNASMTSSYIGAGEDLLGQKILMKAVNMKSAGGYVSSLMSFTNCLLDSQEM